MSDIEKQSHSSAEPPKRKNQTFRMPSLKGIISSILRHFHKPTHENLKLLIISFLGACVLWLYIATRISNSMTLQFSGVPIQTDMTGMRAESYGLRVMTDEEEIPTVNVTISGKRTSIGAVTKEDVIAYVDFDAAADQIGTQTLPIKLKRKDGVPLNDYKLSNDSLEVRMDRYQKQVFDVTEVDYSKLSFAEGVNIDKDNIICDPPSVSIFGPTQSLQKIHHVRVTVTDSGNLYETRSFSDCKQLDLIDAEGNVITDTAFQVQETRILVKIPVYYTRRLPVTVALDKKTVPTNFNQEMVLSRLRLSTDSEYVLPGYGDNTLFIDIKTSDPAKKNLLYSMDEWSIGTVSLTSLSLDNSKPTKLEVKPDEGYEYISNIGTVYVTVDGTELTEKTLTIYTKDITQLNPSPDYHFTIQSGIISVTLIGTKEQVSEITAQDIVAEINLGTPVESEGIMQQSVTFKLPQTATSVWVSGTPKVNVTVTRKTET